MNVNSRFDQNSLKVHTEQTDTAVKPMKWSLRWPSKGVGTKFQYLSLKLEVEFCVEKTVVQFLPFCLIHHPHVHPNFR